MQPIDYVSAFGPPPSAGFASAMEAGQRFGMMEQQQAAAREKQQMLMQQQQAESLRQQQIREATIALLAKPNRTMADYENLGLWLDKEGAASVRAFGEARTKEQDAAELKTYLPIFAALKNGKKDVAIRFLRESEEAYRNSGLEQEAKAAANWVRLAEEMPTEVDGILGARLMRTPEGRAAVKEALEQRRQEALAPAAVREATARADSAAVAARFAEAKAIRDLALTDAQIRGFSTDEEIKRQNVAIAAMNARTAAEGNALKRQELQQRLDELQSKRDSTIREKNADLEAARGNIDNMLNTADRVLNTPMGVVGSAAGPISARIPTMAQSTADFEALVETLGSQSFLAQIPNIKGMGQLSNAEGEKLQAALQNFSLKQSPEQLIRNVREAQRLLLKARQNIEARYGAAPSVPDTPAARSAAPRPGTQTPQSVDELVRRYGGGG